MDAACRCVLVALEAAYPASGHTTAEHRQAFAVEGQAHQREVGAQSMMVLRDAPSWEVLSQQLVSVFVGAARPRALRIIEVDVRLRGHREALVFGHLQATPSTFLPTAVRQDRFTNYIQ